MTLTLAIQSPFYIKNKSSLSICQIYFYDTHAFHPFYHSILNIN